MPFKIPKTIISFLLITLLWKIASLSTNSLILPSPEEVISSFATILLSEESWITTAGTAGRALAGLLTALLAGVFTAIILSPLTSYIRPVVTLLQNIPLISWTLLAIVWFGFTNTSVSFVVFTATFPVIYLNTISGLSSINPHFLEVSKNFRLPPALMWYGIELASVGSHISVGISVAIAIMWKSVVMAELFASIKGIGFAMETSRTYLQTDRLMAWTLLLVILGLISDMAWRLLIKSGFIIKVYRLGLRRLPVKLSETEQAPIENITENTIFEIHKITKGYWQDEHFSKILGSTSLKLNLGEAVYLSGLSGTGKTTLLRIMAGLEHPDSGEVSRNGRIPCLMFQEPRLLPWFTAEENIVLVLRRKMSYKAALLKARLMLNNLKIPHGHYPQQLSGGMQKAVSLARTLAVQSDVILLDEPFSSSDPGQKSRMTKLITAEIRPENTVMIVSHHSEDLSIPAHRRLELKGSPATLSAKSDSGNDSKPYLI